VPDPVAWTVIEHGWKVLDAEREEIGRVSEVTGDHNFDVFDGLRIGGGILARDKYVPSENVAAIYEGEICLDLTCAQVEALQDYSAPPEELVISSEKASLSQRLTSWLRRGR
jgi:hypothetical protein